MNSQQERIARVIAEQLGIETHHVTPEKAFVADFGTDSLDDIELVMALEDEFQVQIEDHRAEKVVTVADAFALVAELTAPSSL